MLLKSDLQYALGSQFCREMTHNPFHSSFSSSKGRTILGTFKKNTHSYAMLGILFIILANHLRVY